jgi:hypothetical protein
MNLVKSKNSYPLGKQFAESEIYAVMLDDGYYITEDDSLSLSIRDAKQFSRRKDAIGLMPYWQGQGHECYVIDITDRVKTKLQICYQN